MKLFVAICSLMVAAASGQGLPDPKSIEPTESRTRQCAEGEGQQQEQQQSQPRDAIAPLARGNFNINPAGFAAGQAALGLVGRGKRQAGDRFNPENTPFVWFTTNGESITKQECEKRSKEAINRGEPITNRGPVFVQRGVYDVCVKFDAAPNWFFTKGGTNAGCDPTLRCCEWFPPYNNPCSPVKGIFWFESFEGNCEATWASLRASGNDRGSLFGVEYLYGANVGEARTICHVTNPKEFDEGSEPELKQLEVEVTYCAESCCIYQA